MQAQLPPPEQMQIDYDMGVATQNGVCRKHGNHKHVTFSLSREDGGDHITACLECIREIESIG